MGRKEPCRPHLLGVCWVSLRHSDLSSQSHTIKAMRKQTRAMQISQRASEKIPELQDAFGTSAVTLANLLYPWWGWLGTSCFSTFNYFAVASLSEVSPTLHVGVCARNWVCISPSLSSSLDLNGKDHLRLSGLLLELLHTHTVRCSCSTLCPGPGCHASTNCSLDPCLGSYLFSCTALNPQTVNDPMHNSRACNRIRTQVL